MEGDGRIPRIIGPASTPDVTTAPVQEVLSAPIPPRLARLVAPTAAVNLVAVACGAVVGIMAARFLGPTDRGYYTAITSWFGLSLVLAEVGQTAAVCYHVAREKSRPQDYLRTSRALMLMTGIVVALAGFALAPLLSDSSQATLGYRLLFVLAVPVSLVSGSSMAALQARNLSGWNVGRLIGPVVFLAAFLCLAAVDDVTLLRLVAAFAVSIAVQALVVGVLAKRTLPGKARVRRALIGPLLRYGGAQLASRVPVTINGFVDKIVLSLTVQPAELGHYAVAVAFTSLVVPVATAIGSVVMPRIAGASDRHSEAQALARRASRVVLLVAFVCMVPVALTAHVYVPFLLGEGYGAAIPMIWILAPGAVFYAANQVQADLLLGFGQPLAVARSQGWAALVTVVLLALLVPLLGAEGAAIASTASYAVAFVLLRKRVRTVSGPAIAATVPSVVDEPM